MTAFSEELKSHTAAAHQHAEGVRFVSELLAGRLDAREIANMLLQNLVIYRALEGSLAANDDSRLAAFKDPALHRVAALEADMKFHFGSDWESQLAAGSLHVTSAARNYEARIAAAAASPAFLVANHYVRYLGDLSGGQIVASLVGRHYGVGPDGLNFYEFTAIPKPKPYKDAYRAKLDAAGFTRKEKDQVLRHAVESFELNRQVFVDLDAARLKAAVG